MSLMGCALPEAGGSSISRQCLGQALRPLPWESPAVLEVGRQPHLEGDVSLSSQQKGPWGLELCQPDSLP